ncbi:UNVERIFIED_CONTAM: hypothetical protein FKN15_049531 [Acipenser sinensis]
MSRCLLELTIHLVSKVLCTGVQRNSPCWFCLPNLVLESLLPVEFLQSPQPGTCTPLTVPV